MKLITRKVNAAKAAERYKLQYQTELLKGYSEFSAKYESLIALGPNPDPDKVDEVIGNWSWTAVEVCGECGQNTGRIIQIGEEPYYESATALVCQECLEKALTLIKEEEA